MIKIERIEVSGWEAAIRGMRNPMESWERLDTAFMGDNDIILGKNDCELMKKLVSAGTDHSKFMRMINASMDIKAPLYWWKEFDTYKVGTVANSCSTMHRIHAKEFTLDDFSHEHLRAASKNILLKVIEALNIEREEFIGNGLPESKGDKEFWWNMIQLLPSSYNQKRTIQLNYEVLRNMYFARREHKLDEWRKFCRIMLNELPYFAELIGEEIADVE